MFVGFQVDPKRSPKYVHSIKKGGCSKYCGHSKKQIDSSMSVVRVCSREALLLQRKLKNEFFSWWNETCDVQEYHGFELSNMDELLHRISDNFMIKENNIYNKLLGIEFCEKVDNKIFEFTFEDKLSSGVVHFGMVAISKKNNVLDAISCLYTLNFKIARVLVTKTVYNTCFGLDMGTVCLRWFEQKSLGFVTQQALVNFCRYKALKEFNDRNLVSSINDVSSLQEI